MTRKGPVCDVWLRKAVIEMNYKGGLEPFAGWGPCAAHAPAGVHCWLGFHTCMNLETSARALEVKMCLWLHDLPSQWADCSVGAAIKVGMSAALESAL